MFMNLLFVLMKYVLYDSNWFWSTFSLTLKENSLKVPKLDTTGFNFFIESHVENTESQKGKESDDEETLEQPIPIVKRYCLTNLLLEESCFQKHEACEEKWVRKCA